MIKSNIPVNPRSKKNSQEIVFNRKTGHRMVIQNKRYTEFEKECKKHIPILREPPINYPINLQCKFYVCDARKRDIANYLEAIQDILVKYGILEDDNYNIVSSLNGCSMEIDRDNPRIEIIIEKIKEQE
jgi:Holliday junction resolvase RusA-like endonuclease